MRVRGVVFTCDTPICLTHCQINEPNVEAAFEIASKHGWTARNGKHFCAPCTRQPPCCRCDPALCETDDTGDHCATAGCAWCLDGCPAPEGMTCCQPLTSTTTPKGTT